jgi:hypothetical protein
MTIKHTARRISGFFAALVHASALSVPRLEFMLRNRR